MATTVDDIIDRLGGAERGRAATGRRHRGGAQMAPAGAIPARHWPAVIAATGLAARATCRARRSADGDAGPDAARRRRAPPPRWCWPTAACSGAAASARTRAAAPAEVCFNTGMTGYQETLTDPSYAGQIITFTFPHIGNVGTNGEDIEATNIAARGPGGEAGHHRAVQLARRRSRSTPGCARRASPGIAGVDTRALTVRIRDGGAPNGVLAYPGRWPLRSGRAARAGRRLAGAGGHGPRQARSPARRAMPGTRRDWAWPAGLRPADAPRHHVVAVDYGAKRNILRCLAAAGCRVTVVPATATAEDILRHKPDGVFLSNGPGDPAATGEYAVPAIQGVLAARHAAVRHLPRPPVAGAGARRRAPTSWRAAIAAPTSR